MLLRTGRILLGLVAGSLLIGCGGVGRPLKTTQSLTLKSVAIATADGSIGAVTRLTIDEGAQLAFLDTTFKATPPEDSVLTLTLPLLPTGQKVTYTRPRAAWTQTEGSDVRFTLTIRLNHPDAPIVPSATFVRDMVAWLETGRAEIDFTSGTGQNLRGGIGAAVLRTNDPKAVAQNDFFLLNRDQDSLKFTVSIQEHSPNTSNPIVRARLEAWPPGSTYVGTPQATVVLRPRLASSGIVSIAEEISLEFLTGSALDTQTNRLVGMLYSGKSRIVFDREDGSTEFVEFDVVR
jgi:hypothetical protein